MKGRATHYNKKEGSTRSNRANGENRPHNNRPYVNRKNSKPKDIIKLLHSCAKAGKPKEALGYLAEMQKQYAQGNQAMKVDFRHYNSVMHAWVKSHAKGKEYRAKEILDWMCNLQVTDPENNQHLKPTNISFNVCINAFSKSRDRNATEVAWELFESIEPYHQQGVVSSGPDYHTYRAILHALLNNVQPGYADRAEKVLHQMYTDGKDTTKPDDSIYHIILHIYSHNKEKNSPQRAEALVNNMHSRFLAGEEGLKPSTITFNTLLNTYAKSKLRNAAERAEKILHHMQDLYEKGFGDVQPDIISFNTVLNAHASSQCIGSDLRAYTILQKMRELYCSGIITVAPNTRTYNACLKACLCKHIMKTSEQKKETFDRALDLMKDLHESHDWHVSPDEHSYDWFLRICSDLCEDLDTRQKMASWAFDLCKRNGLAKGRICRQYSDIMSTKPEEPSTASPTLVTSSSSSDKDTNTQVLPSLPPIPPQSHHRILNPYASNFQLEPKLDGNMNNRHYYPLQHNQQYHHQSMRPIQSSLSTHSNIAQSDSSLSEMNSYTNPESLDNLDNIHLEYDLLTSASTPAPFHSSNKNNAIPSISATATFPNPIQKASSTQSGYMSMNADKNPNLWSFNQSFDTALSDESGKTWAPTLSLDFSRDSFAKSAF